MADFNCRWMKFECACGKARAHVQIGINSWGELVAQWKCLECEKTVMARMPLEQLIADIPPPNPGEVNPTPPTPRLEPEQKCLPFQTDASFLREFGIEDYEL